MHFLSVSTQKVVLSMLLISSGYAYAQKSNNALISLPTAYDYQLLDHEYKKTDLEQLVESIKDSDVVFVGEYHRNQASHLLEMQVFAKLHSANQVNKKGTVLSMEMFTRDQQSILNDYLASNIGERYLIEEAPTWKNYQSDYRPLVEYAKKHNLPVIAANAAGDIVRCIGRTGEPYLEKLTDAEKTMVANEPFANIPGYQEKFFGFMGKSKHASKERLNNSYLAQITRDNTMAESIANVLKESPNSMVVHLNGSFHSQDHLGTVGALRRINPNLKIRVITPIHLAEFNDELPKGKDEFYYVLNSQPKEFVDDAYKKKMRGKLFSQAREKAKRCKE